MKTTKQDLIARDARLSRENDVLSHAVYALVRGDVKWFGRSPMRLGIAQATRGHGGIAVVDLHGSISAHYWEDYRRAMETRVADLITGEDSDLNRELLRQREILADAQSYVTEAQREAFAA